MRYFLLLLFLAPRFSGAQVPSGSANLPPQNSNQLRIEQVQTNADVVALLRAIDSKRSICNGKDTLFIQGMYNRVQVLGAAANKSWEKLDINQDGQPDLLISGRCPYEGPICLINRGQVPPQLVDLPRYGGYIAADSVSFEVEPVIYRQLPLLLLRQYGHAKNRPGSRSATVKPVKMRTDTLVYRSDDFIKFNPGLRDQRIIRLTYDLYLPFSGRAFQMTVDFSRRKVAFQRFFFKKHGFVRRATLDNQTLSTLYDTLIQCNFPDLKDSYATKGLYDGAEAALMIIYTGGRTKRIGDYGLEGTKELSRLYDALDELIKMKKW